MLHKYSVNFTYNQKKCQITVTGAAWYVAYSKGHWMSIRYPGLQVTNIRQLVDED